MSDKKLKVSISSLLPAVAPSPAALKITSEYENSEDKTGAHEFHPYMYVHVGPWAWRVNSNTVIQVCLADTLGSLKAGAYHPTSDIQDGQQYEAEALHSLSQTDLDFSDREELVFNIHKV